MAVVGIGGDIALAVGNVVRETCGVINKACGSTERIGGLLQEVSVFTVDEGGGDPIGAAHGNEGLAQIFPLGGKGNGPAVSVSGANGKGFGFIGFAKEFPSFQIGIVKEAEELGIGDGGIAQLQALIRTKLQQHSRGKAR